MNHRPEWLLDYASNTYSQSGEDGVIARILATLPEIDSWCVEFGAWDGIHLSNVRKLITERSYNAILIEGDGNKFESLRKNYADNTDVIAINAFVGFTAEDGLDKILSTCSIPKNFDILSIDIDGNDYHVWKAVEAYRPKVVCIEFNPTIPTEVDFVQAADPAVAQGSSLLALVRLAHEKGYELVSVLSSNAIFVDQAYFPKFGISNNAPNVLRKDCSLITWFFSGYDGSIHLAGAKRLPWHSMPIDEQEIQVLPRSLQIYPGNSSDSQIRLFLTFRNEKSLKAQFQPQNDLERLMQSASDGKEKFEAFIREFMKNQVFVLLDKEMGPDSTSSDLSPLIVTNDRNEFLVAVFTAPERSQQLKEQAPQFQYGLALSAASLFKVIPSKTGLVINPDWPVCLEWNVEEVRQLRIQYFKE